MKISISTLSIALAASAAVIWFMPKRVDYPGSECPQLEYGKLESATIAYLTRMASRPNPYPKATSFMHWHEFAPKQARYASQGQGYDGLWFLPFKIRDERGNLIWMGSIVSCTGHVELTVFGPGQDPK